MQCYKVTHIDTVLEGEAYRYTQWSWSKQCCKVKRIDSVMHVGTLLLGEIIDTLFRWNWARNFELFYVWFI
jgi:hypothetical protein